MQSSSKQMRNSNPQEENVAMTVILSCLLNV